MADINYYVRRPDNYVFPERISRLCELAYNLWWSWHYDARRLFKALDRALWKTTVHNPVRLLFEIPSSVIQEASEDPTFLKRYDDVVKQFDDYMGTENTWCTRHHPGLARQTIAYFSMEYAIHSSLPLYAGGLGVLSGDYCKEASDLGLPLVAVGFMYPQGYFHQHISAEGRQEEIYVQLDFNKLPVNPAVSPDGKKVKVKVELDDREVWVDVWQVNIGRVRLYLLDTNTEENPPEFDKLSARLYCGDAEMRLQQEILLGIGGVRVLRALGIQPAVWHINEGHAAFSTLERTRELVQKGLTFDEAARHVRATTVFTTHTPVPAGNDVFHNSLIEKYFRRFWDNLKLDRRDFLALGSLDSGFDSHFQLTPLALRMADHCNGVSRLHGQVTRRMWRHLWPDLKEEEVPIKSITNGMHVSTWIAPQVDALYRKYLGMAWASRQDDPELMKRIVDIPDEELWAIHQWLKRKLITLICDHARQRWADGGVTAEQALAMGALLDSETLTIGFARRFTDYKRPALIFRDVERISRILQDPWRPVQIVFTGKSHPADERGKQLIEQVYNLAKDRKFGGRIAFVEDYDMHIARYFVQGVDVWLNNPRPLQEASGTSGMKACLNGVLHLSVPDGWWYEGYNGLNGWKIGDGLVSADPEIQDTSDSRSLYELLEQKVIPAYYDRDRDGIPCGWIQMMKEAIRSTVPFFCTCRMTKEYTGQMYSKASRSARTNHHKEP